MDQSQYTAIIVEPRKHNALEYVMTNFTKMLDSRWNFIIFHGTENKTFVQDIVNKIDVSNRIKMINLHVDNLTINTYNQLFYTKSFYHNIPSEVFLVFQTDTIISERYKDKIYDFIQYDYVGAPWFFGGLGNGGLSLRRKSKMLEILDKCNDLKYNNMGTFHNEDMFFSIISVNRVNVNKPSYDKAKEFSIETVYNDKSFGVHNCWKYLSTDNIQNIIGFCPELYELMVLNNAIEKIPHDVIHHKKLPLTYR